MTLVGSAGDRPAGAGDAAASPSIAIPMGAATVAVWGFASPLIKAASVGGEAMAFYRLWIGAIALLALVAGVLRRPVRAALWPWGLTAGALFGVNLLLFVSSVKTTTVANATLIGVGIDREISRPQARTLVFGWHERHRQAQERGQPARSHDASHHLAGRIDAALARKGPSNRRCGALARGILATR